VRPRRGARDGVAGAPPDEASAEGRPALVVEDTDREAVAEALADALIAALEREGASA
jgi:hypothetical protein